MKDEFFGFYEPTQEEIDKAWKEGTFVFDTNALLNLYRYSDSTRKDFLLAINKLKEKLFMPYQVGLEYHTKRRSVIDNLSNSYTDLLSAINELFEKAIKNLLNQYVRHPSIQIENIQKLQNDFLKKVNTELEKQKLNHPDFITKDEILNQLTGLYKNKIGIPFSKDDLKKIYIEGKDRYDQKIPPGYKDKDKNGGDQHVYGDLIIWKEIISHAIKEKKPIIFVTDDRKEDWWTIENGKTIRAREDLIKEFYDLTGIRILIYNTDSFLHLAKERKLVTEIKETSISEVKEVRKADENYYILSDFLKSDEFKSATQFTLPPLETIHDFLNSDAYKSELQLYMPPVTPFMSDFLKSDEFKTRKQFNLPATASISDFIKSDAYKSAIRHYPISTFVADVIKSNAIKEATVSDIIKNYNESFPKQTINLVDNSKTSTEKPEPGKGKQKTTEKDNEIG